MYMLYIAMYATIQVPVDLPFSELLYEQVPQDECRAEGTCAPEYLLRRAPSLRRALELLVSASDIFRGIERVLHKLINVRSLYAEVVCKRRLQFGYLCERFFGLATCGVSGGLVLGGKHIPDFVELVLILLKHILVLLREQLELLRIELVLNDCARLVLSMCSLPTIINRLPSGVMSPIHPTKVVRSRPCSPSLVQHTLALLNLSHEPYLHHITLETSALL